MFAERSVTSGDPDRRMHDAVGDQPVPLLRVASQGVDGVADEPSRCLVPCHEQENALRYQLLHRKGPTFVRRDKPAHQVIGWCCPAPCDLGQKIVAKLGDAALRTCQDIRCGDHVVEGHQVVGPSLELRSILVGTPSISAIITTGKG